MSQFAPSVPAGSHEMRDNYSNHDPPRSSPYTAPSITPYLGLRSRLSQIWINRWTILLVLVLVRILIACQSINQGLDSGRTQALSACSSVESMGSAMASMPHYMAQGANELTAAGLQKSVNALMESTTLAVTAAEEITIFVLNMMYSTYLCLIKFAVNGTGEAVVGALNDAQNSLNGLTQQFGDDLASRLSSFNATYEKIRKTLAGTTTGLFTGVDFPTLDLGPDIDQLHQLKLPANLSAAANSLNSTIISFDNAQKTIEDLIRSQFEAVKSDISSNMGKYTFNGSLFPVPQKEQMTFCSSDKGINGFFNDLDDIVAKGVKIAIAVIAIAAILACIPMAYREVRRWRTMKSRSYLVGSHAHDPMDVVYIVSRPYTATAGIKMSSNLRSNRRQILVRWVVAYATTEAALFVLALALAGLFSCLCNYFLLKAIQKEVPALTNQVGDFADQVIGKLNNASEQWAIGTNKIITDTNNSINHDMFGWAVNSTAAVNDTLNQFVDATSEVLNLTFGGTILRDPVQKVLDCLILLKVASLQKGLTFVHDNAHIDLPLMPVDVFSKGASASISGNAAPDESFLATPGDVATDKISDVVTKFVNSMTKQLRTETIISLCILSIYITIVLIAIIRAATLWNGHDKVRGDGGAAPHVAETQEQRDFRSDDQDRYVNSENVPMGTVNNVDRSANNSPAQRSRIPAHPNNTSAQQYRLPAGQNSAPAPRYSTAMVEKELELQRDEHYGENPFNDSKNPYVTDHFYPDRKG